MLHLHNCSINTAVLHPLPGPLRKTTQELPMTIQVTTTTHSHATHHMITDSSNNGDVAHFAIIASYCLLAELLAHIKNAHMAPGDPRRLRRCARSPDQYFIRPTEATNAHKATYDRWTNSSNQTDANLIQAVQHRFSSSINNRSKLKQEFM